jgi:hypothetical protein
MGALVTVLAVCVALGHLLDRGLLGDPGAGLIERFGRALALGLGLCGCVSMAMDAAGLGVTAVSMGAGVGVVALGLAVACVRGTTPRAERPEGAGIRGRSGLELALWAALLLLAAFGVGVAVRSGWIRPTMQFDAIARWMLKAKALHFEDTLLGPLSTDPEFGYTHQRYPPLVSHVANLVTLVLGKWDDRLGSAIFPWYAVATVALAYGAVARRSGALTGALAAFWIAHLPILSYTHTPPAGAGAASAMADIPMGLFLTGAVLAAADAVEGKRDRAYLEAGLFLGMAMLTKNEALPFVVALGFGLLLAAGRGRLRKLAAVGGIALAMFLLLWGWIAAGLPAEDENYPGQLGLSTFLAGIARLEVILPRLGQSLIDFRAWNLTWPAVLVLLVAGGGVWRRPGLRLMTVALVLQLGTYVFAYMITAWSSPAAEINEELLGIPVLGSLMRLTLDRLLMHLAPAAICAALIAAPLRLDRSG